MKKKKIPYGKSEFRDIKLMNYYYVDKTRYISIIEDYSDFLFIIRPRRFGKSLYISMLHYYYDENCKDEFEEIFKDTLILKNRTELQGRFKILRFNFSEVDATRYEESFYHHIDVVIDEFVKNYRLNIKFKTSNPLEKLSELFRQEIELNIYCLIDEYDNFANELLSKEKAEYEQLVKGQESIFKHFFKILKSATDMKGGPLKRLFITGVTPMVMFDVTSGFNIGDFATNNPNLNSMLGFTKEDVAQILEYYEIEPDFELLDSWYNNYRFSEDAEERIYNSDMIWHYVKSWVYTGKPPKELADLNIRTDYGKLKWLVYTGKKLNGNFNVLEKVINGETITTSKIKDAFSAFELIDEDNFISLMYYLGLLTIEDKKLKLELRLPNNTIKEITAEYIKKILESGNIFKINLNKFSDKLAEFALNGNLEVFRFLGEKIKESTSIRDYIKGEQTIKAIHLTYLNLCDYYFVISEPELNKRFADIALYPRNPYVEYFALIELKYLKRTREHASPKLQITKLIDEAKSQLDESEQDEKVRYWISKGKKLKKIIIVYYGCELAYLESV
ncbi:ATP-binding protein [Desulfothermus naphthae]